MADATNSIAVDLEPEDWERPVLTNALPPKGIRVTSTTEP
jgi:hypothetical protein